MKGWLYVISNRAVKGMVKVGGTPKDPAAYAKSLDKAGLPFPHEVGYEALVADIAAAEKIAAEALAHKAEGRGWYSCTVAEAAREITAAVAGTIILESRYDGQTKVDKLYDEVTSQDPARRIAVLSDSGCPSNVLRFAIEREEDEAVILAMLANPACETLGEGLADLAKRISDNDAVLAAMASNHRLPPNVLGTVFHCAIANGKGYENVLLALVRNPRFSSDYFYEIVDDYWDVEAILPAIAARLDCDPFVLAKIVWLCDGEGALSALAKRNPNWSAEEWLSFLEEEVESAPDIVAGHPDCPPSMFERLWRDSETFVKEEVLANPACPTHILVEASLAKDREEDSDEFTAKLADVAMENPSNPLAQAEGAADAEAFAALADSQFPKVVVRVAANSLCPEGVLSTLSHNGDPEVRRAVAGNRSCPTAILSELAHDGDPGTASAALRNPGCLASVLEKFANNELYEWKLVVLENPSCPRAIVENLAKDKNHKVRTAAKSRLSAVNGDDRRKRGSSQETLETVRERFRNYARRKLGALIEESELLRLSRLPEEEREKFDLEYPSQAKQLALFEKYLLSKLQ